MREQVELTNDRRAFNLVLETRGSCPPKPKITPLADNIRSYIREKHVAQSFPGHYVTGDGSEPVALHPMPALMHGDFF